MTLMHDVRAQGALCSHYLPLSEMPLTPGGGEGGREEGHLLLTSTVGLGSVQLSSGADSLQSSLQQQSVGDLERRIDKGGEGK